MEERGELGYKDLKGSVHYLDYDGESMSHYGTVNFGPNTVVMTDPQSFTDGSEGFHAVIVPYHRVLKVELDYTIG
jgi:hypothetical protein